VRHYAAGSATTLCTVPPTPIRPTCVTLEEGRRSPRREDERLLHARTGLRRDVRLVGAVTSVAIGPVRPSPPSRRHPGHCTNIPDAVGACGDRTPPRRRTASRQRRPQVLTRTAIEQATSTPPPLKPLLYAHRKRHDAPPDARFARTAVYSATLYTVPLHVDEIVRHACCRLLGL
jgi:hypothetical protein